MKTLFFVVLMSVAALPAGAFISGSSTASNCGEGGNWIDLTFTSDEGVRIVDAWWDFNATNVWLDADGTSMCGMINEGVTSFDFYFDGPVGENTQDFGLTATGFDSGDYFRFVMDLDLGSSGSPFSENYFGGTVRVVFSDGTVLTATFDEAVDWPNGAIAEFIQLSPLQPNLTFNDHDGWYDHLVPRPNDDAVYTSVTAPAVLYGDSTATWFNTTAQNAGMVVSGAPRVVIYRDGQLVHTTNYLFGIAPGGWFGPINAGPYDVPGGRHTLRVTLDPFDTISEYNEDDNDYAVQYVWRPAALTPFTMHTRAAPPRWSADTDYLPGSFEDNCDGVRILPQSNMPTPIYNWRYVLAQELKDSGSTFYLQLFNTSDDPHAAFRGALGGSANNGGLEAILINTRNFGAGPWDVGIYSYLGDDEDYEIQTFGEGPYELYFGAEWPSTSVGRLAMPEFYVGSGQLGPATLTLYANPDSGPVHLGWLGPDHTVGNLTDLHDATVTDAEGCAKINLEFTQTGYYSFVSYRNQGEHPGNLVIAPGLWGPRPDLEPVTLNGWYAPFVPRPAPDAALFSCGLPDTLHGNAQQTWLNIACKNSGTVATDTVSFKLDLDGDWLISYRNSWSTLNPGLPRNLMNLDDIHDEPWQIPGGRHTLTYQLDYPLEVAESVERNNWTGRQYCWSPLLMADGATVWRDELPDRDGGLDLCDGAEPVAWNCDGLRLGKATHETENLWRVLAVMPRFMTADIDLQLHQPLVGTLDGFGAVPLDESVSPAGQIEFVVVNGYEAGTGHYDYGVLDGPLNDNNGYNAEVVSSGREIIAPSGPQAPMTMAANQMIDLHEVTLEAGTQLVTLEDLGGGIDWGLSIYGAGPFHDKADALDEGIAWERPAGQSESIFVTVPARGHYCIAVWKVAANELSKAGDYRLHFAPGVSGTHDQPTDLPVASRLTGAMPNPFNPRTTLSFTLTRGGPCRLAVHDLQGHLVRTLVTENLEAGRHEAVWDGLDRQGNRAASGVYVARLTAPDRIDLLKVTLVK